MRELEVKAVVPDVDACRDRVMQGGARLTEAGTLHDWRFDTPERALRSRDVVLRIRELRSGGATRTSLDWKGPARFESGYKEREEVSLGISHAGEGATLLERLGFRVIFEIERRIEVFALHGAAVRFERYARMDTLVEVEGEPDAIEQAIATLGIPREAFTTERLADFARRFEERTGERAAVSKADLAAPVSYALDDA